MTTERPPPRAKPGRPSGGSSEETQSRIVLAARRVFAANGFANTQNRRVAEEAGVTTSTLYHYFESKLDLYATVFRESERELARQYGIAKASSETLADRVQAILDAAIRLHEDDPSLLVFMAGTPSEMRNHPEVAATIARCPVQSDRILHSIFEEGVARGELDPSTDVRALVTLVLAATSGISLYASFLGENAYPRMVAAVRALVRTR